MDLSGWDFDSRGGSAYVGVIGVTEVSVPSAPFYCQPKAALKNTDYFKKKYQQQ